MNLLIIIIKLTFWRHIIIKGNLENLTHTGDKGKKGSVVAYLFDNFEQMHGVTGTIKREIYQKGASITD